MVEKFCSLCSTKMKKKENVTFTEKPAVRSFIETGCKGSFISINMKDVNEKSFQPCFNNRNRFYTLLDSKVTFYLGCPPLANLLSLTKYISRVFRFIYKHVSSSFR